MQFGPLCFAKIVLWVWYNLENKWIINNINWQDRNVKTVVLVIIIFILLLSCVIMPLRRETSLPFIRHQGNTFSIIYHYGGSLSTLGAKYHHPKVPTAAIYLFSFVFSSSPTKFPQLHKKRIQMLEKSKHVSL